MVLISSPENFDITQKYASLPWEIIIEPAPIANTQSSLSFSVVKSKAGNNGRTIDAEVIMATVAGNNQRKKCMHFVFDSEQHNYSNTC